MLCFIFLGGCFVGTQVPVLESFPSPLVPTTAAGGESDRNSLVVAPVEVRLRDDMWLSSRTFFVIDAEVWCLGDVLATYFLIQCVLNVSAGRCQAQVMISGSTFLFGVNLPF